VLVDQITGAEQLTVDVGGDQLRHRSANWIRRFP
jgi:hypothetical protein